MIRPCPFCGNRQRLGVGTRYDERSGLYTAFVRCKVCKARGAAVTRSYTDFGIGRSAEFKAAVRDGAIAYWNAAPQLDELYRWRRLALEENATADILTAGGSL